MRALRGCLLPSYKAAKPAPKGTTLVGAIVGASPSPRSPPPSPPRSSSRASRMCLRFPCGGGYPGDDALAGRHRLLTRAPRKPPRSASRADILHVEASLQTPSQTHLLTAATCPKPRHRRLRERAAPHELCPGRDLACSLILARSPPR